MLSVGKVRAVGLDYYTLEEFAIGDLEYPASPADTDADDRTEGHGRWIGEDLASYGLDPDATGISSAELRRVLTGLHASTGDPLPGAGGTSRAVTSPHRVHSTVHGAALQESTVQMFPSGQDGKTAALAAAQALGADGVLRRSATGRGWTVGLPQRDINGAVVLAPIAVGADREGVLGYDLTFSAPKSVSVLAVSDPAGVRRCQDQAVEAAMGWGSDQIGWSRAGHNGVDPIAATVGAAAAFTHAQSRAGDPQLHTHVLIPNRVLCADGAWRALDGRTVYANAAAIGTVYQAALRANLTHDLGVAWTPVDDVGFAEVVGVPDELLELWSSRSTTVDTLAAQVCERAQLTRATQGRAELTKAETAHIRQSVTLKTRPSKEVRDLALTDGRTLTERWTDQAKAAGHPITLVHAQAIHAGLVEQGLVDLEAMAAGALDRVASRASTFTRAQVAREVARLHPSGDDPGETGAWVDRVTDLAMGSEECLQIAWDGISSNPDADLAGLAAVTNRPGMQWFTTRDAMTTESRILDRAVVGKGAGWGVVPTSTLDQVLDNAHGLDGLVLSEGQLLAVDGLVGSGDGVEVLDVSAGPGKNLVVGRSAMAWRADGQRVVILSPQAEGAKILAGKTGVDVGAASVGQALNRWEGHATSTDTPHDTTHGTPTDYAVTASGHQAGEIDPTPWRVDARTVIVVDHASTLTRDQIDKLTEVADRGHAKIVLLGDTSSLSPSKSATGMFRSLRDAVGGRTMEVDNGLVGREPWAAAALQKLRDGRPDGLGAYLEAGRLHSAPDRETGIAEAVTRYQAGVEQGARTVIVAGDRITSNAVNDAIAESMHAGMNPLDVQRIGDRDYAAGDTILLRSTDTRIRYAMTEGKHGLDQTERDLTAGYDKLRAYQAKKTAAWVKLGKATSGKSRAVTKARIAILDTRISTTGAKITDLKDQVAVLRAEREMAPYVRAGSRATITSISAVGQVTATELLPDGTPGETFTLPRPYVHQHTDHAFAMTVPDVTRTGVEADQSILVGSVQRGLRREGVYGGLAVGAEASTIVWDEDVNLITTGNAKAVPQPGDSVQTPRTAYEILTQAMERSASDVSVAERKTMLAQDRRRGDVNRMRAVAGRAETLVEIADRKQALTERVIADTPQPVLEADPALVLYFAQALETVPGGDAIAAALTAQDGWGVTLAALEACGHDQGVEGTKALLVAAIQDRPLDRTRPIGPVLDHRLRGSQLDGAGQRVTAAEQELRLWTVRTEQVEAAGQPATTEISRRDQAARNVVSARQHAADVNPLTSASREVRSFEAILDERYKARLGRDTDTAIKANSLSPTIGHRPANQPDATPEAQAKVKTAQAQWRSAAEADVEYRARWIDRGPQRPEPAVMLPEQATARKALTAATDLARDASTSITNLARKLTQGITRDGGISM